MGSIDRITGTVERITYHNPENNYSVVKIIPDKRIPDAQARDNTVTIVGVMPEVGVGETLELHGQWIVDAKYGKQFRVERMTPIQPTSLEGIRRYLASGIVRGIGEATAAKITDHFGLATLDILNNEPHRLHEVMGLKASLIPKLIQAWEDNVGVRNTMIYLQQYNVSPRMATRIYEYYGSQTVETVKKNPYLLADDVFGIGFLKADQVALRMGLERDSSERIRAGLTYALNELAREGHTCAPRAELIEKTCELLRVDAELTPRISAILDAQLLSGDLIADQLPGEADEPITVIYLPGYYTAEQRSAELLRATSRIPSKIMNERKKTNWQKTLAELARSNAVELTDHQQSAVQAALTHKVSVLTGGPGTGKTTTLRMVIAALVKWKYTFALASPTGRAAKRLQETTGYDAFTIHRLLGYTPQEGFAYNEDQPLDVDFLIVDESSMIDLMLFYSLLKALKPETHLMLVGDVDQLPSVGAGNVLSDVIASGIAHVTRLRTIFRQNESSHIVLNAHRINNGEPPLMDNQSEDFFFFTSGEADDLPAWTAEMVIDVVQNRLPQKFPDLDPIHDIQVIAPMYRGMAGVDALNSALQARLNSDTRRAEKRISGRLFKVGDKVMQTRNNYEREVFNGDIGFVHAIDFNENLLEIVFDNRYVFYDFTEAEELIHAYCISTHRSQGSEYPVVVMPVLTQHYMMLQRNLLYTAITRAKRVVVMIGDRRAVYMAVNNNRVSRRYSGLLPRLREL